MIYLASPYSHDDPAIREGRFQAVCRMAGRMMGAGLMVFSPIAHTHPIALVCNLPKGWDYWQDFDRIMIGACDRLWIGCFPGWKESTGIQAEVTIAQDLGKPVVEVAPFPEDTKGLRLA